MQVSQLDRYSIGIAAENKPLTSRHLNITPVEVLSALDGEINFAPQDNTVSGVDADGNRYEVKTTQDMTLTAEWLPLSSNRVTPPDIRRGELVEIYRVADSDQFFWRCMGLRDDLRRLETVIFAFNGSPDEGSKGIDPATCYFMEVSTHKKTITVSTSQSNGEPFGYTAQINAGEGQVVLEDTIGNTLFLDSGRVFWELINADQTHLQLDRTNIYGKADNNIEFRAGNDVYWEAGNNMSIEVGNNYSMNAGNNSSIKAGSTASMEGGSSAILKSGGSTFTLTPGGTTLKTPSFSGGA